MKKKQFRKKIFANVGFFLYLCAHFFGNHTYLATLINIDRMKNKKENIAEYILYLWQLEDYLRAFPEMAEGNEELSDILRMMHADDVMDGGHIQLAQIALKELEELSDDILAQEATFRAAMIRITPSLNLLKARTDRPAMSNIEACLLLLYQIMMLRLQHREISAETQEVQQQATGILQYLSKTYYKQGELEDDDQATL